MASFPRVPFVPAEEHVDWRAHENEILGARLRVERGVLPKVRRLAVLIQHHRAAPLAAEKDIAQTMERHLARTARFGYVETQREIIAQRSGTPRTVEAGEPPEDSHALLVAMLVALGLNGPHLSPRSLLGRLRRAAAKDNGGKLVRYSVTGVGHSAHASVDGFPAVLRVLSGRAEQVARDVTSAMLGRHSRQSSGASSASVLGDLLAEGARVLHNETLDVVGEALNLGRAAGGLALQKPPKWAMRSEQLDRSTCAPCDTLHGATALADSAEFYALMPPQGCLGGGRCRGIIVFADDLLSLQVAAVATRRESVVS